MIPTGKELRPIELLPHQAAFVETFFSPVSKRIILLRADVGLGRTVAVVALVRRLQNERPAARALFLVPSALRLQIVEMLSDQGVPSLVVDRYRFREMLDSTSGGEFWPGGTVAVLSMDFAKKPDIRDCLTQTRWDLVVAEEGHWIRGARADALRRIGESADRVVLTMPTGPEPPDTFAAKESTVIEWRRDQIVDHNGKPLESLATPILHEVIFSLSPAELSLRAEVDRLCQIVRGDPEREDWRVLTLLRSLESSPPALERALQMLTARLTAEEEVEQELMGFLEGESSEEDYTGRTDRPIAINAAEAAERVLQDLNIMAADSKLEAFTGLVDRLEKSQTPSKRLCILTNYLATLYNLAAEIEARAISCQLLHGRMSIEDRHQSMALFSNTGGILVATTWVITEGLNLPEVTDLILYDIPDSKIALQQVLGRFDRTARVSRLSVHVLTPSNSPEDFAAEPLAFLRDLIAAQARPQQGQ